MRSLIPPNIDRRPFSLPHVKTVAAIRDFCNRLQILVAQGTMHPDPSSYRQGPINEFRRDGMAITLKDVAERAGVSRSAVSRTFTSGASVSSKTRAKVEKAATELGYSPNALASSLTTGRTKLIGLISNNFHNPLFLEVFDLFTRGLQDRGLRPLLVNLSDETDPGNSVRMLRQYSVDGVIVASSTLPPSFAEAFRNAGVPVVHSFGRYTTAPYVHVVGIDNIACGRMAAEALIARGYTRVAFLGGPESATSTQDRARGFFGALAEHPEIETTFSYASAYSFDAGRVEMTKLLMSDPAQAYFCGDDVLSVGALSAIEEAGLSVPGDIGLIGLNDMDMSRWQNINLTTIRQPIAEIIEASIDLVVDTIEAPHRHPETRLFPCRVIDRGTLPPA
jgi:DNA-binding LacI/PurR family transcriptional regulator